MGLEKGPGQLTVPEVVRAMNLLYEKEIKPLEQILEGLYSQKSEAEDALSMADDAFETAEGNAIVHVQETITAIKQQLAKIEAQIEKVLEVKRPHDNKHKEFEKLYQSIVQATDSDKQS